MRWSGRLYDHVDTSVIGLPYCDRSRFVALALASSFLFPASAKGQGTPPLQSLNPDISIIGDFLADLSPEEPRVNENHRRFSLREIELAAQAAVDPYFRADFFLGVHEGELDVEEAYLTALSLPGELQARLGRIALPLGKVNVTHRPELLTPEYPLVIRRYFGSEGLSGTGIGVSRIIAPLGFFQEIEVFVLNGFDLGGQVEGHSDGTEGGGPSDHADSAVPGELRVGGETRRGLDQLAVLGHLRSFYDLSAATNIEVGLSGGVGTVERFRGATSDRPLEAPLDVIRTFLAQRYYGMNTAVRWRPPGQALFRSFIWSTEWLGQSGPESLVWGGFSHAEWQTGRRTYLGARFDAVQTPGSQEVVLFREEADRQVALEALDGGEWMYSASAGLTFFPSEFSRFRLWGERSWGEGYDSDSGTWKAVFQTTFSIGPHRPHAF